MPPGRTVHQIFVLEMLTGVLSSRKYGGKQTYFRFTIPITLGSVKVDRSLKFSPNKVP